MQEHTDLESETNTQGSTTSMQSMRFTDILAGMFTLYRSRFCLFLGISVVFLVVGFCIDQISMYINFFPIEQELEPSRPVLSGLEEDPSQPPLTRLRHRGEIVRISVWLIQQGMGENLALVLHEHLEIVLLLPFIGGALTYAAAHAFLKRDITVGDTLKQTSQRFFPLLSSSVFWFFIVFGSLPITSTIIGIILGLFLKTSVVLVIDRILAIIISIPFFVYFGVRLGLYYLPMLFERTSAITALSRSTNLVKGSWWRVFGIMVAIVLITFMIAFILSVSISYIFSSIIGTTVIAESTPNDIGWSAYLIWSSVKLSIYIFSISIGCIGLVLLYFDMWIRKDPDDLEIHVNRLRSSPHTSPELS